MIKTVANEIIYFISLFPNVVDEIIIPIDWNLSLLIDLLKQKLMHY